jgi:hypothetical protein
MPTEYREQGTLANVEKRNPRIPMLTEFVKKGMKEYGRASFAEAVRLLLF